MASATSTFNSRWQRGVSMIEVMLVLVVTGLAVGASMPGVKGLRQRAELTGVAAQIETDVHFARSAAVARNHTLRLTLKESHGGTCYLVHSGPVPSCDCEQVQRGACEVAGEVHRAAVFPASSRIQVRANTRSMTFDPVKGTVTPTATLRAEARDGRALHQVVSLLGRVRTCTPQASMPGLVSC
jgi:type IV fimbrial biogenesis protein FimT